jgi:hypothetical protein
MSFNSTYLNSTHRFASRRDFLASAGCGAGILALQDLLRADRATHDSPLSPQDPHFPAKATSVIWLFMHGAPSHVDTWDYKPELAKRDGQTHEGFDQSTGFFAGAGGPIMKSPFRFAQFGETGSWVSEIFPHLSTHVDRMAMIHSCYAKENNHAPAQIEMNTGMARLGFPAVGSWVTYGLGTVNQNLPGFIVMYDAKGRGTPKSRSISWGSGFLPGIYQGTPLNNSGAPIEHLSPLPGRTTTTQRSQLELLKELNRSNSDFSPDRPELEARIKSFELAYRMQVAAPEAFELDGETEATHSMYGTANPRCAPFAKQALVARRLVERGVRFVQIFSGGFNNEDSWDAHANLDKNHRQFAGETDQPISALLTDLDQRGLLDSTLVVCCGEFGRLPLVQTGGTGRDHNPLAFTTWMAGGGIKAAARYGSTDDLGLRAEDNPVSINDLHATILHLLGMNHQDLTYRHEGRDIRLTDVEGVVLKEIIE